MGYSYLLGVDIYKTYVEKMCAVNGAFDLDFVLEQARM